jgi:nucleotide-binding universal stress UspA family protein
MDLAVLLVVAWLAVGAAVGAVMWRRGFDGWAWFVVGVFMGPLAIAPALARRPPTREYARLEDTGLVDVLIGFDGSPESRAAIVTAHNLFGARLGRLTVATAVPIDLAAGATRSAAAELEAAVQEVAPGASTQLVEGRPAQALSECAGQAGYEVIVVGTRGAGMSKHVLGSVATELAHSATVPVLLVPASR